MLTKDQYKELTKNWGKHSSTYQKFDRYKVRFPMLLKHIDVFKDKNVLEVGCNAGLAAYHIAQVAKNYTGVEAEIGYWNQALETQKQIESKNTAFLNMSIKTYMKRAERGDFKISVNAAYLSYVLYHFSDKEVQMFEKEILPKLDVVVVQSRYAKRNKKGRRTHNSYGFWHPKNVAKFLARNGFYVKLEWGPNEKFHFIIGEKRVESGKQMLVNQTKGAEEKPLIPQPVLEDAKNTIDNITMHTKEKEEADGDTRGGETDTEGKTKTTSRSGTSNRQRRSSKRMPRTSARERTPVEGKSEDLQKKKRKRRDPSLLQPGMEKSAKAPVRKKNVSKAKQTSRTRPISTGGEDNNSTD